LIAFCVPFSTRAHLRFGVGLAEHFELGDDRAAAQAGSLRPWARNASRTTAWEINTHGDASGL
jgi:hypothetical protein